jgi:hypothetical protein
MRGRIERRGLSGLSVLGTYQVSRSRYRTHPDAPVRLLPGAAITGATMREVFAAIDAGNLDDADELLGDALAEGYGMGRAIEWHEVDALDFRIR